MMRFSSLQIKHFCKTSLRYTAIPLRCVPFSNKIYIPKPKFWRNYSNGSNSSSYSRNTWRNIILCTSVVVPTSILLHKKISAEEQVQPIDLSKFYPEILPKEDEEINVPYELEKHVTLWDTFRLFFRAIHLLILFSPLICTFPIVYFTDWKWFTHRWYIWFEKTLVIAGPCWIKLGQWMGTRLDLFPVDFCQYLSKLHNHGYIHSYKATKEIIKRAFGKNIEELFDYFESKPIASGAIAQVYKARLKKYPDLTLAVKVRHPKVKKDIKLDLILLRRVMNLVSDKEFINFLKKISLLPQFKWLNIDENIQAFSLHMLSQVDLSIEAKNLKTFAENFESVPNVKFPKPIDEFCHPAVLTETFEAGLPASRYLSSNYTGRTKEKKILAKLAINMYLKMIVIDNFVHTDLHPGNILIQLNEDLQPNGNLIILDAGLVSRLSPRRKKNFLDLLTSIVNSDSKEAAKLLITRAPQLPNVPPLDPNNEADREKILGFMNEMAAIIDQVKTKKLTEIEVGKVLQSVLELGRKYRVPLDSKFTALAIGTIVVEGLGKQLDPELDFISAARPILVMEKSLRNAFISAQFNKILQSWK